METITKENYKALLQQRNVEEDTVVLNTFFQQAGNVFLMKERWKWESICGSTFVAYTPQLEDNFNKTAAEFNKTDLYQFFIEIAAGDTEIELIPNKSCTLKIAADYTFFNFDFQTL